MGGGPPATVRMVMDPSLIHIIRNEAVVSEAVGTRLISIDQHLEQDDGSASLEGYVVDTVAEQLSNYLSNFKISDEVINDLKTRFSRIGIIKNLWVDEELRGQGIGSDLVSDAINAAYGAGAETIILIADSDELRGDELPDWYANFGFHILQPTRFGPLMIMESGSGLYESSDMGWGGCWIKPNGEVLHLIPNEDEPIHHAEHVFDDPELDALVDQRLEQDDDADSRETAVDVALEAGWIRVRTHTSGPGEIVVQYAVPPSRQARRELYDYVRVHRNTGRFYMNSRKFNSADELLQAVG